MVVFRPFKAVRPADQELAEKIASLPYDVVNSEEARNLANGNQKSFLRVVKPEIDLSSGVDPYSDAVYLKGKENLEEFQSKGWLIQDQEQHYFVYRLIMEDRSQFGLVGCVSAEDYWADKIKKHELTRPDKEADRIRHVDTQNANAGPVFLFYDGEPEINKLVDEVTKEKPLYDVTSTDTTPNVQHTIWKVPKEKNEMVQSSFQAIPHIYVADGHHRTATGAIVAKRRKEANPNHTGEEEYNFFLAVLFPANQLKILDYNRVVKDLNGLSKYEFLEKAAENFDLMKDYKNRKPSRKSTYGMYLDNQWFLLTAKDAIIEKEDPIKSLDIAILNDNLLAPILGIGDPRTDKRIDFVGGIRGMDELERRVDSNEMVVAFSLYPTSISELKKVADAGLQMPPKSTWFEPKLRSGFLIHIYE